MLHDVRIKPSNEAITDLVRHVGMSWKADYRVMERNGGKMVVHLDLRPRPEGNITVGQLLHVARFELSKDDFSNSREIARSVKHIGQALGHLVSDEAETTGLRTQVEFNEDMTPMVALAIAEDYLKLDRQARGHELAMREVVQAIGALQNHMLRIARPQSEATS